MFGTSPSTLAKVKPTYRLVVVKLTVSAGVVGARVEAVVIAGTDTVEGRTSVGVVDVLASGGESDVLQLTSTKDERQSSEKRTDTDSLIMTTTPNRGPTTNVLRYGRYGSPVSSD
jgi:hypothetical protein